MLDKWTRVTKSVPCPVCGKPDWCLLAREQNRDGSRSSICTRTESPRLISDRHGEFVGFLHREGSYTVGESVADVKACPPPPILEGMLRVASSSRRMLPTVARAKYANDLGVSDDALRRMQTGLHPWEPDTLVWPMLTTPFAPGRSITGVRTRHMISGEKRSVRGGHAGLFVPDELRGGPGPLLIEEGPTSTAALLTLGFDCIGRPSCSGGVPLVLDYCLRRVDRKRLIVVVGNNDEEKHRPDGSSFWPGQEGAAKLAVALAREGWYAKMILPLGGHKDSRAWLRGGATAALMNVAINMANVTRADGAAA